MDKPDRKVILKTISGAIGLCASVKPEVLAKAALEALEEKFTINKKDT